MSGLGKEDRWVLKEWTLGERFGANVAWFRLTDPASHHRYETPPEVADISGYEVRDFHLPAGFRVSPVGYESEERFKDRLRQRMEDRDVLELLRDDAPKVAPRERPDAAWCCSRGRR